MELSTSLEIPITNKAYDSVMCDNNMLVMKNAYFTEGSVCSELLDVDEININVNKWLDECDRHIDLDLSKGSDDNVKRSQEFNHTKIDHKKTHIDDDVKHENLLNGSTNVTSKNVEKIFTIGPDSQNGDMLKDNVIVNGNHASNTTSDIHLKLNKTQESVVDDSKQSKDLNKTMASTLSSNVDEKTERKPLKLKIKPCRPKVLKNHESGDVLYDRLFDTDCPRKPTLCSEKVCLTSIMGLPGRGENPRTPPEVLADAKDFLEQYFASKRRANTPAHETRWQEVQAEVAATGTYQLTDSELAFGAKLAWRNASRCIGRIQWSKLQVFDCRYVTTTSGMFEALCNHIKYSTNKGNIRSAITLFPQRTDNKHDYRIWNSQLISYAGYRNPDGTFLGDPIHAEFTELCIKLGWKAPRTEWDILPLVLSANGKDPDFFEIPRELVLEVHMTHPTYEWFKDLGLRWYAVPAVSNMRLDVGGIEFTANAFNGWYMSTEIGCRDFCDVTRKNMLEPVAQRMGLDTRSSVTLWKDRALVEVNVAVLHSFQLANATIVDHHTASESFIKHLDNENKLRSGCPADWVWIVPPMSSSITPVFHQEMALYYLKPTFEYQDPAWKTHQWTKTKPGTGKKPINRKFHFKQIARAVKFTSKLFGRALSRRIKATVLYATETGKSEQYAKQLGVIFGHAFNAQVHCMTDYDISSIEHEALLLIVTSTFGNGDPPENGESFANDLYAMKMAEDQGDDTSGNVQISTPKSFIKANSQIDLQRQTSTSKKLTRLESLKGSATDASSVDNFGPLSNVRFAVFALGSSAYPKFAQFGKYVDRLLGELGGERMSDLATGDEMMGQEEAFRKWASSIFRVACDTFCLDDDDTFLQATEALGTVALSEETVRLVPASAPEDMAKALQVAMKRKIVATKMVANESLYNDPRAEKNTIRVEFDHGNQITYSPGDHVGVMACNSGQIVNGVLARLADADSADSPVQLQLMKETHTSTGPVRTWEPHERLPVATLRDLFMRYLDITTPPATKILQYLATTCSDEADKKKLINLATDSTAYEDWRHFHFPHLLEVLEQFPSAKPRASLLVALLSPLQPRFYSISSSPLAHPGKVHLTVAVVTYKTQDGKDHYGVGSNFLMNTRPGETVYMFSRTAPNFHLPADSTLPLILVGPGTGIAPFRGFWHHRRALKNKKNGKLGPAWLFFGCRSRAMDLYSEEKEQAKADGALTELFLATSREDCEPKMYVQTQLEQKGQEVYKMLKEQGGHFYVCGDCKMAEDVHLKLLGIIKKYGNLSDDEALNYTFSLRDENRYHEDIFGITLRTAEVHSASRESARMRLAEQP